jgi:hypothetical protein
VRNFKIESSDLKFALKAFILFAVFYNGYKYFYPWKLNKAIVPLYFYIIKDIPWFITVVMALNLTFKKVRAKKNISEYNVPSGFFVIIFVFLAVHVFWALVALVHVPHKNIIDLLQRDIKNVQYIFLPLVLLVTIKDRNDIFELVKWILKAGAAACLLGFGIHWLIDGSTYGGAFLSTFGRPMDYGVFLSMLALVMVPMVILRNGMRFLKCFLVLGLFYAGILSSQSLAGLLSFYTGMMLVSAILFSLGYRKNILKFGMLFLGLILPLQFTLGNATILKISNSVKSMKTMPKKVKVIVKDKDRDIVKNRDGARDFWETLKNPYFPRSEFDYEQKPEGQTSISSRIFQFRELSQYWKKAPLKSVLFGDFKLRNQMEYDNIYYYWFRNNGVLLPVFFLMLLTRSFLIGLKNFHAAFKNRNLKTAALLLGISMFILTATVIEFNTSYYPIIYPLNFFIYFFVLLASFINPYEQ